MSSSTRFVSPSSSLPPSTMMPSSNANVLVIRTSGTAPEDGDQAFLTDENEDQAFLPDEHVRAADVIAPTTGQFNPGSLREAAVLLVEAMGLPTSPGVDCSIFTGVLKMLHLSASAKHSPLALKVACSGYTRDDGQSIKQKIEQYTKLGELAAKATEEERKHLLDYVNFKEALPLVEAEVGQLADGPLKEKLEAILCQAVALVRE